MHLGSLRTPNQSYRITETHIGDLNRFLSPLGHSKDNIFGLQPPFQCRGTSGNNPDYFDIAILFTQQCPDTLKTAAHMDIEIFLAIRGHVIGVRIEGTGNRIEKAIIVILQGFLMQPMKKIIESFRHPITGLLPQRFLIDLFFIGKVFFFQI